MAFEFPFSASIVSHREPILPSMLDSYEDSLQQGYRKNFFKRKTQLVTLSNFYLWQDTFKKIKRQVAHWEWIFTMHIINRLLSRLDEELLQIKKRSSRNLVGRWTKGLHRTFTEEATHVANRHMKRCVQSLVVQKMNIKTVKIYHFTPVGLAPSEMW